MGEVVSREDDGAVVVSREDESLKNFYCSRVEGGGRVCYSLMGKRTGLDLGWKDGMGRRKEKQVNGWALNLNHIFTCSYRSYPPKIPTGAGRQ